MERYPSIGLALDALQARNEELEHLIEERTDQLEAARREAEIVAALERVRSQAMAVQHTDETVGVAVAVFDALRALGLPVLQIGLTGHPDAERREAAVWTAGIDADGTPRASHFMAALTGHPVLDAVREAGGLPFVEVMDGHAFRAYLRASVASYPPSYADRVVARAPRAHTYHYVHVPASAGGSSNRTGHLYAVLSQAPTGSEQRTLERFSADFSLAYARYLGLQQAEAQARASRVGAALERVRAHVLAMRGSQDIDGVIEMLFDELRRLGARALRTGAAVVDGATRGATVWTTLPGHRAPDRLHLRLEGHPLYDAVFDAWRQQKSLSYILEGADRAAYYRIRSGSSGGPALGDREYVHAVPCSSGVLYAFAPAPFAEDTVQLMQRLAGVFHMATTRHRDLQQAETQARETAQQASADRVRAEIASMRTVGDLDRIMPRIWQELTALGVTFDRCAVLIVDEETLRVRIHLATPGGEALAAVELPFGSHPFLTHVVDHWRRQAVLAEVWPPDELDRWITFLEAHGLDHVVAQTLGESTEPLALYVAPFVQGMLLVGGATTLPAEDGAAVHALADAFEVAYARYDDFRRLEAQKQQVEAALADLRAAQQQLVESEKLASLGALTAGIAHEIKNPLNFIVNFAALSRELADEIAADLDAGVSTADLQDSLADLKSNAERIEGHGRRADSIVRGMMQHARTGEAAREPVDLNDLVEEYANLAFHGKRAQVPGFGVTLERDYDEASGPVTLVPQDIGRVVINLLTNAFDAVLARAADDAPDYTPTVRIATRAAAGTVTVEIADNGTGIAEPVRQRIFEPFFTTKPPGAGTGLGLSMSHDIVVHRHSGRIDVESTEGEGTTFTIRLPR